MARAARKRHDNDIVRGTFERTGASVMGKRMFDAGEQMWPEQAPFHTPVFVVTHEKRDPWERPGGTTSTSSMTASSPRSTRLATPPATGTSASRRWRNDPGVRERRPHRRVHGSRSPVLFGSGIRLFEGVDHAGCVALEPVRAEPTQRVTHLTYAVRER